MNPAVRAEASGEAEASAHWAVSPEALPLVGMCSACGFLGYCEERRGPGHTWVRLICTECRAVEVPVRKPPARETQGELFAMKARRARA